MQLPSTVCAECRAAARSSFSSPSPCYREVRPRHWRRISSCHSTPADLQGSARQSGDRPQSGAAHARDEGGPEQQRAADAAGTAALRILEETVGHPMAPSPESQLITLAARRQASAHAGRPPGLQVRRSGAFETAALRPPRPPEPLQARRSRSSSGLPEFRVRLCLSAGAHPQARPRPRSPPDRGSSPCPWFPDRDRRRSDTRPASRIVPYIIGLAKPMPWFTAK